MAPRLGIQDFGPTHAALVIAPPLKNVCSYGKGLITDSICELTHIITLPLKSIFATHWPSAYGTIGPNAEGCRLSNCVPSMNGFWWAGGHPGTGHDSALLNQGRLCPPGYIQQYLVTVFVVTLGTGDASSGHMLGVLLNGLRCLAQLPMKKKISNPKHSHCQG